MGYKAILFDLDDTLLNREHAVERLFFIIVEKCYKDVKGAKRNRMLQQFRAYDRKDYGNADKTRVLASFFDEFPPQNRLADMQRFWNEHFPNCFSVNQGTIDLVHTVKQRVQVAIITNGTAQRQRAKIENTELAGCFETIIISEEAGYSKPDRQIFELALQQLQVKPEEALFVGDDLEKDMGGCQNAGIKGIWYNPSMKHNETLIKPFAEIEALDELVSYIASVTVMDIV